jgi:predicted transcriptional regulator
MMHSEVTLLDVLFPKVRAEILRALFSGSNNRRYVRELMRETGLALCTVQDELRKLSGIGIVTSYSNGYHRFYAPNAGHPVCHELRRIVEMSDRLPGTKRSTLLRRQSFNANKARRRRLKRRMLRPDRSGVNWNLFSSHRPKT